MSQGDRVVVSDLPVPIEGMARAAVADEALAAGLIAGPGRPRETFPRATPSEVEVNVVYPGARAEDIETAILERIEAALDAVTDLATASCEAREGLGRAVAAMREGSGFRGFLAEVTAEVDAITDFPDRLERASVRTLGLTDFVASVAVTGPDHRPTLEACAQQLRTRMLRWDGIAMVDIRGFPTFEIRIDMAPAALRRFDVSIADVARAVGAQSLDMPAGSLDGRDQSLLIRIAEERRSQDALADIVVRASSGGGGTLKFTAFPEIDGDTIEARVLLPQGTPQERTDAVVASIVAGLHRVNARLAPDQPEGADLVTSVTVFNDVNRDAYEAGAPVATVSVDLLPSSLRSLRPDPILAAWRAEVGALADVVSLKYAESTIGPAGIALDMRLKGDDLDTLKPAATELTGWLAAYDGVTSAMDDLRPGKPELRITLKDSAGPMGVTAAMVADQLRAAYQGSTIGEIQSAGRAVGITARLDPTASAERLTFDEFAVTRADATTIPLSVVAAVETGRGVARINREDGRRTVAVRGTIDTRVANANAIVSDTLARFIPELLARYPDLTLDVEGQRAEASTTQVSMMMGFVIGLFGVFALLSFQFRSYVEPIVVMLVIPLALAGAIFGHMLMGLDFSMPSLLGYVALAGVVVNNSILLVDFIRHEHREAGSVAEAA